MSYTMYIDDVRNPKNYFDVIARTYQEAIFIMEKRGCPKFISFDHDLGYMSEFDAVKIVDWMINKDIETDGEFNLYDLQYSIHSTDPVGADNIRGKLNNYYDFKHRSNSCVTPETFSKYLDDEMTDEHSIGA